MEENEMSTEETAEDILNALSQDGKRLAQRVLQLERENLHVKNPTLLTGKIVEAAKELAK
ncbi:hypothetical protein D3C59_11355 [Streptomyces sp. SHP22-7]|jgi:hypothetical protein|nr:hypothetical protein D3C59_11355 [Streptomyces sp. SHP22-7]